MPNPVPAGPAPAPQGNPRPRFADPRTYHSHPAGPGTPAGDAGGLAQFANSDLGKWYSHLDDPYQEYVGALTGSIGKQRQALDAHLSQALDSLGQRRDAAAQTYAALPGQLQQNGQFSQEGLGQAADSEMGGLSADTKARFGDQLQAPVGDAARERGADEQFSAGLQPLLDTANTANYTVGQDRLNAEHLNGEMALDQQQGQIQATAALQKAQAGQQLQSAILQQGFAQKNAEQQHTWDLENQTTQAGLAKATDPLLAAQGLTQAQAADALKNPAYKWYSDQISKGDMSPEELYYNLRNSGDPALQAVVIRNNPEYFKADPTTGQPGIKVESGTTSHPLFNQWVHAPISTSGEVYGAGIRKLWQASPFG